MYGVTLIVLTIISVMPYGAGLIILIPTVFASIYVSYKDIFLNEPIRFKNNQSEADSQKANWGDGDQQPEQHEPEAKQETTTTGNKPQDKDQNDR